MTSIAQPTRHRRPIPMSAAQTLLWLVSGIAGMFVIVSAIFAVKLGAEGRLPFQSHSASTAQATKTPSASPDASPPASGSGEFVSGAENILPPEASHLAKVATSTPPATSAPPAEAAPPSPAKSAASTTLSAIESVAATLQAWAAAWERKDVNAYLKHYADDFQPARGLSRDAWAEQRRERLARADEIEVEIAGLNIEVAGDKATARFAQSYHSGSQNLNETKTIELIRRNNSWLILQERIGH